jgi:hypothetical protein
MSTEHNKEIVRRYRRIHTTNQLDQLDEIVAADLITHNLLPDLPHRSVRVNTQVHPYTICSRHSDTLLLSLPLFEPCLEPQQTFIPYGADVVDPLLKFAQRFRRQDIALFSPFLMHGDQARSFKDREMLENTLPRNWVFLGKLGRRLGTGCCQQDQ